MSIFLTPPSSVIDDLSHQTYKSFSPVVFITAGYLLSSFPALAEAPTAQDWGMAKAYDMIYDLDDIVIAAFVVCLVPFAAMTTLRFLNMVLGRV